MDIYQEANGLFGHRNGGSYGGWEYVMYTMSSRLPHSRQKKI